MCSCMGFVPFIALSYLSLYSIRSSLALILSVMSLYSHGIITTLPFFTEHVFSGSFLFLMRSFLTRLFLFLFFSTF